VAVGTFFGIGYSIPPLRFKVRGWLHAVSLTVSAFFVPALFVLYTIAGTIAPAPMLIVIGFSVLHYGIAFANQAIDYLEDKAGGVKSPPVLWGMATSLKVALGAIAVGMLVEFAGLYYFIVPASVSVLGVSGVPLFALTVPIILAGYFIPVSGLWKMHRATLTRPIADATRYMKEICHYNRWQASGIMGLMLATGILFFGAIIT
jgi:4-hydroxybenzoate polyprenyltransferase